MRVLGMTAALMTLAAVVLNTIWFIRQGFSFGDFLSVAWPAALTAFGVLAGAIVIGFLSVRLMLKADAEAEGEQESRPER